MLNFVGIEATTGAGATAAAPLVVWENFAQRRMKGTTMTATEGERKRRVLKMKLERGTVRQALSPAWFSSSKS